MGAQIYKGIMSLGHILYVEVGRNSGNQIGLQTKVVLLGCILKMLSEFWADIFLKLGCVTMKPSRLCEKWEARKNT